MVPNGTQTRRQHHAGFANRCRQQGKKPDYVNHYQQKYIGYRDPEIFTELTRPKEHRRRLVHVFILLRRQLLLIFQAS